MKKKVVATILCLTLMLTSVITPIYANENSDTNSLTAVVAVVGKDEVVIDIGVYSLAYNAGKGNQLYDYLYGSTGIKLIGVASENKYMDIGDYSLNYEKYGSIGAISNTPALSKESISEYKVFKGFDENGNPMLVPLFEPKTRNIISIKNIPDIVVNNGTTKENIGLPTSVTLVLDDSIEKEANVIWNEGKPNYDGNTAGEYIFTGTIILPENVLNPKDLKAEVKVLVEKSADKAAADEVIAQINGLPAEITLADKDIVEAAREAYNALTAEQKELVGQEVLDKLIAAENRIKELEEEKIAAEKLAAAIKAAEEAIKQLPTVENVKIEDKGAVENAKALVAEVKVLKPDAKVEGEELIALLEAKIAELEADQTVEEEVNNFKTAHATALGLTVETVTIGDKEAVNAALTAYEKLSDLAKGKLTSEKALLDSLLVKIGQLEQAASDQAAAQAVMDAINQLPAAEALTLGNKEVVVAARNAYDKLTEVQKALVTNLDILTKAEAKIAELEADQAATEEANSFRTTHADVLSKTVETIAITDKESVNAALSAYEGLSDLTKGKLTSEKALLDSLLTKIRKLEKESADEAAAQAVMDEINELPELISLTLENREAVEATRDAYESLTAEQKKLVSNIDKLIAAENRIKELEEEKIAAEKLAAAIKAAEEAIKQLPTVENVKIEDKAAVENAKALVAAVKELKSDATVEGEELIALLEVKIAELEADKAATEEANSFKTTHADVLSKTVETIAITDKESVNAALAAYEELSEAAKGKLIEEKTLLDKLLTKIEELEKAEADKKAVEEVISKIDSIPAIENLTLADKSTIEAARAAYNSLTDEQKKLVSNVDKLTAAEAKIAELEADQAATEEANSFKTTHADVLSKTVNTIAISDKGSVNAALTAYEELSDLAKERLIEEKALLDSLLTKIVELEKLEEAKAMATAKVKEEYTITSWDTLTKALALPEVTSEEVVNKTTAINVAITSLVKKSDTNDIWNGDSEAFSLLDPNNSDNSEANPYIIDTSAKLANLATQVRSGNNYEGKYFVLDANLDLNGLQWVTIGDWDGDCHSFNGYFDGNNNTIKGMKINEPNACAGLFSVTQNAQIKNLTVLDPIITRDSNPNDYGSYGVIVGEAYDSKFEEIHVINSKINGGWWIGGLFGYCERVIITSCSVTGGSITATNWKVGGITAGAYDATIKDCVVNGTTIYTSATGFDNDIGGIIGYLENCGYEKSVVENCSFDGNVTASDNYAGGIVGHTKGAVEVTNCTTKGTVTGSSYVGGILGADDGTTTIADSISHAKTSGINYIGGIVGYGTDNTIIENNISDGVVTGESNVGQIAGIIANNFPNGLSDDNRIIDFVNDSTYPWKHDVSVKGKVAFYPTNQGIGDSTSSFTCKVLSKGILAYDYKVSAENNWDYLKIYIDDVLAKEYKTLTDWTSDYIILSNDTQIVKFEYKKDSGGDSNDDKVWIANIELCPEEVPLTLTVDGNEYGSISGTYGNNELSTGVHQIPVGTEVKLNAIANSGASFYGWVDKNGKLLSTDANYTFNMIKEIDIKAVFAQNGTYVARKDGVFYKDLATALKEAVSGDTIRLIDNCTLNETTTVPKGVTLMIPYNATTTSPTEKGTETTATGRVSWANESKYLYLTLDIPENVTLNVDGSVIVGAVQHYPAQNYQGNTSGAYSQIICDGAINVNNGGVLDLYGLIKGSGTVTAYSGAKLYQPFMIADYAGGNNTQDLFGLNQTPFNRYAMVNIQTKLVMHYGSTMYGHASLYFWSSITTIDSVFVGEGGLIVLSDGATLTATYDANKYVEHSITGNNLNSDIGKTTLVISGGAKSGYMEFPFSIKTNSVYFSIPYNYDIVLENGNYNFEYPYKLMPGASLWVKNDATLEVTSGLYVYDGLIQSDMSGKSYPTTEMLQQYHFSPLANFIVDGTFIVRSGKTFGGIIQTNGGGKVILEENANVTNETVVDGGKTGYDVSTSKFSLPARVYNADSNSLIAMEAGKTYIGQKTAESWLLTDYVCTYAKNANESDYDADISKAQSWYHKWTTTTTTINQPMTGAWIVVTP